MDKYQFDQDAYLRRIGYSGKTEPTVDTLKALHYAQIHTLPFENFDIQLDRGINLDPEVMFEKLVRKKRGGYCFELNGLFQMALEATGFDVRPLLCRVHRNEIPSCRVHQISLVNIDGGQWIADAGSGSGTLAAPILLELDQPIIFKDRTVRLIEDAHLGFIVQYLEEEDWSDIYSFDLGYVLPVDIECANHFTSTHPSHFFTFSRVAALPLENGRISLHNHTLKRITSGKEDIQELSEGQEYLDALKNHFGIELDASYEDLRPLPGTE